jgi:hypothetical protein
MLRNRQILMIFLIAILGSGVLAGCSAGGDQNHPASMDMAPLDQMPAEVQSAPVVVQQAYQFAAANPDVLEEIPCYCGCGAMGHTSNYACYIAGDNPDGGLKFDAHALGCSICVDITQDTMRLLKQGQSLPEIRAYVDENYAKFGPSNIP